MAKETLRFVRVQVDQLDPGPLPVPFQDATMGPFTHWKMSWLRLTADDGRVGQAPGAASDETARTLLAEGPFTPQQWWHRIWWMNRNAGHRNPATSGLLYALDMAFRDVLAQRANMPWHRYMGATRDSVPVYGSGGGTNRTEEELVAEMKAFIADGYTTVKMKVGTSFGSDMPTDARRVKLVREAIGGRVELAIDGNQTWNAQQALAFAQTVADQNIVWFEEPVHSADRAGLRELCATSPMPIAMGESENHWLGFRDLADAGVRHLQPNPHCLPGFDRWMDALAFTEPRGGLWTCGGFSHLTAMYVATRPAGMVEYLSSIIGHLATCLKIKPEPRGGMFHLPKTPGLPAAVDWDGLKARNAVKTLIDLKA